MIQKRHRTLGRLGAAAGILLAAAMLFSTLALASSASYEGGMMQLGPGQVLDSMGFFAGPNIRVDGTVHGTVFAAGQNIVISGDIDGDLFVAGQTLSIPGTVSGNVYVAGQGITLAGDVGGDVFAAGQDLSLDPGAFIARDLTVAGAFIALDGTVGRDLNGGAANVDIGGTIGRHARLEVDSLRLGDAASIGGDLAYRSEREGTFAPGSTISGRTDWTYVDRTAQAHRPSSASRLLWKILGIGSALLVWLFLRLWRPAFWSSTSTRIYEAPLLTLGMGSLALIVTPMAILLLLVTVIGIPAGILLGIAYGVSIYLSRIVLAAFLGYWAERRLGWRQIHLGVWLFLLGYVLLALLLAIPFFGALLRLVIVLFGLGALLGIAFRKKPQEPAAESTMPEA